MEAQWSSEQTRCLKQWKIKFLKLHFYSQGPHLRISDADQLTETTLFFPARFRQVGQFPVFVCQLEFSVIKARLLSEAFLSQAPIAGQLCLPVHLKLLQLKQEEALINGKHFFPYGRF